MATRSGTIRPIYVYSGKRLRHASNKSPCGNEWHLDSNAGCGLALVISSNSIYITKRYIYFFIQRDSAMLNMAGRDTEIIFIAEASATLRTVAGFATLGEPLAVCDCMVLL